jgi:hypothetical protein
MKTGLDIIEQEFKRFTVGKGKSLDSGMTVKDILRRAIQAPSLN